MVLPKGLCVIFSWCSHFSARSPFQVCILRFTRVIRLNDYLAAFLHIVIHNFRRPLSIVLPGTPGMPSHPGMHRSDSYNDELLQRKERTLQRRRFARRILWDIGVWTLLIPVSGGGLVWAAGRVAAQW